MERIKKLSQSDRLLDYLSTYEPRRTDQILFYVYGGEHLGLARIGARIHDLKKRGYNIIGWRDENNKSLYWYKMIPAIANGELFNFSRNQYGEIVEADNINSTSKSGN